MKQIIPFKKDLIFKTKLSEITSISLEHKLLIKNDDCISGEFYISGEYKMTEASINRESFNFKIPFDIELDDKYNLDTLDIDIDNFYYEVVNNEALLINIDLYVEGDKLVVDEVVEPEIMKEEENTKVMDINFPAITEDFNTRESEEEVLNQVERPAVSLVDLDSENTYIDNTLDISNDMDKDFNIFNNIDNSDTYVTYHVYIVKENDTIDSIMKKYNVDKETLSLYNDIEDIKPNTKLIIPGSNE